MSHPPSVPAQSSSSTVSGVKHSSATELRTLPFSTVCASADGTRSIIGNYKPTLYTFRELLLDARNVPHMFSTSSVAPPRLLSARVVRHPISPLARMWSTLIRIIAAANAVLDVPESDWMSVDIEAAFAEKDLKFIMDAYTEIPSGIRHLLQGRVVRWVWTRAALWSKCEHPAPFIYSLLSSVCSGRSQGDHTPHFPGLVPT